MADTKLPPPPDFKGDWITPDHSEYNTAIARWARNAQRNAAAVAFVRDAEDVATAIEFARAQELPIAVRGGGHSAGGASSIDNGVVIDLSRYVNGARVDAERRLVYTGGGALWKTVDEEGIKHGLATVGGTVNHTGVGGLVLGGGIGHLMGEHGHAVDNLVQVTIVTADGSILTASERENSDLFWGVRGGGSNFGVVTEFVLKLHPQRATAFCGNVIFPSSAAKPLFEALKRWWEAGPSPKTSILSMMTLGPDGKPAIVIAVFYNGPEREAREYFKFVYDLGPVLDTAKEIPFEQVNTIQNSNVGHGKNYYMKGTFSSRLRPDVSIKILDRIAELSPAIGVQILYMHELFPSGKAHSIPRDSTAFMGRVSNAATLIWEDESPGKLELARDAAKQLNAILAEGEDVISPVANTGYGNYDMDEKTAEEDRKARKGDLAASLFGDHYPRMQALKKKYDPNMVFSRWNPIRPL